MEFYMNVLQMQNESYLRHALPYPGAFVRCGNLQIHLMELLPLAASVGRTAKSKDYPGRDQHVAISVHNLEDLKVRLRRFGVDYYESSSGRKALFLRDPDQNALEFVQQLVE
jgi:glyoxylase I family protein